MAKKRQVSSFLRFFPCFCRAATTAKQVNFHICIVRKRAWPWCVESTCHLWLLVSKCCLKQSSKKTNTKSKNIPFLLLFLWHWVSKFLIQLEISIELWLNDVNFVSPSAKTMNLRAQRVLMNVRVAMRPNFMGGLTWCKWGPPRYQQCQWRPLSKSLFHLSQWIHVRFIILIYCILIV